VTSKNNLQDVFGVVFFCLVGLWVWGGFSLFGFFFLKKKRILQQEIILMKPIMFCTLCRTPTYQVTHKAHHADFLSEHAQGYLLL